MTDMRRIITRTTVKHPNHSPDTIAAAIWSITTEPGDPAIGYLINELGPHQALEFTLNPAHPAYDGIDMDLLRARVLPRMTEDTITTAFGQASRIGATLITPGHEHWPAGLADLGIHRPHALWVRGNSALLTGQPSTAIVGARAATGYGEHVAMELSAGLVDRGHTIVSGAAYGIDGMAHRAALASRGSTIAYLAGGIDRYYPSGHDALLTRITEAGAVVSEVGCGQAPTKWRFLQRNRLIAATSGATIVVEAGWRSGSLNTAGHASTLNRPLGAVPGPITSAASSGCHRLIRDHGATIITTPDEAAALQTTP